MNPQQQATDDTVEEKRIASLTAAIADARAEHARADSKAFALLSLVIGVFAGVIALTTRSGLPTAAQVLLWIGAAPIAASALQLLITILPWIGEGEPGSFVHAARSTPEDLVKLHEEQHETTVYRLAVTLRVTAGIALDKYVQLRRGELLLITGLGVLLLALAVTAIAG